VAKARSGEQCRARLPLVHSNPSPEPDAGEPTPAEDVYDDQGVDRSQIRTFLALTPRERLERASRLAAFFLRVRALNGRAPTR
jgi:hypothetical protein